MSQLLGILHGREETFPPALLHELNARQAGVHGESITVSSVEALERSPYRLLVDRISQRVPYFHSLLHQQKWLGVESLPSLSLHSLDRVGLAQLALQARVHAPPTVLLPHHSHPAGVEGDDLGNLAYPMPWENYLRQMGLPATLRSARLGHGPVYRVASLGELWTAYGKSGDGLMVVQPDLSDAEHVLAIVAGTHLEVVGYDPVSLRYRPAPEELLQPTLQACQRLLQLADFNLTGLEFAWHRSKLWLSDLHLTPDLEWWTLGEEAFGRIVTNFADELIRRTLPKKTSKAKKTRNQ
ncbi:hypothetical protein ABS71_03415 [bacterium SCN 62-11]|nr:hypothetical protein [Candidatus Eremiobacteraeota bacterium]ODT76453.1 MAG: hypothetical protein ABS71_03415 [bacterium SCN 62-11]